MHRILQGRGRTVRTRVDPRIIYPQWRPHQANPLDHFVAMSASEEKRIIGYKSINKCTYEPALFVVTGFPVCADSTGDWTLDTVMCVLWIVLYIEGIIMCAARKETS